MNTRTIGLASDFWSLTKPRVVALIMLTACAGAALALLRHSADLPAVAITLVGIAMTAGAAAAFNHLVEIGADSVMRRTRSRPLPAGRLTREQAGVFVLVLGGLGLLLTTAFGGALTGLLAAATFFGYAVLYTLYLKRATPQNIVIGGASGAMPPVLGWAAVGGGIGFEPLLLFLLIFAWTPPHFWALALARREEYAAAGIPMLPVTHGAKFTATQILLYGVILFIVALLPYLSGMSGLLYLAAAVPLNIRFLFLAARLRRTLAGEDGQRLFAYSITYLALSFAALLVDGLLRNL